jgi:hypothetical protein
VEKIQIKLTTFPITIIKTENVSKTFPNTPEEFFHFYKNKRDCKKIKWIKSKVKHTDSSFLDQGSV